MIGSNTDKIDEELFQSLAWVFRNNIWRAGCLTMSGTINEG